MVDIATGDFDEAKALGERALAIWEASLGPDHADVAYALVPLAQVALAQGRPAEARRLAERALALRESGSLEGDLAEARFVLARAIVGEDPTRAFALAEQARATCRAGGVTEAQALAEIEAWLAANRDE